MINENMKTNRCNDSCCDGLQWQIAAFDEKQLKEVTESYLPLNSTSENLVQQARFCHAENSCKCEKRADVEPEGMRNKLSAANVDQLERLLN